MKKTAGGRIITVSINTELVTWQNCNMASDSTSIIVGAFYVKNEDTKDIFVRINYGSEVLIKTGELLDMSGLTDVASCIVCTDNATIRWGGLI